MLARRGTALRLGAALNAHLLRPIERARRAVDGAAIGWAVVDRILVTGLRELGIHGVLPEERVRAQPFEVDLELHVDLAKAGASDDLADTVDYGAVCEAVRNVVASESYQLLERLAQRIADVCRTDPRVAGVVVEVRKLEPPVDAQVAHVAVRIQR